MTRIRTSRLAWAASIAVAAVFGGWVASAALIPSPEAVASTPSPQADTTSVDPAIARIKAALQPFVQGSRYRVEDVRAAPLPGLYEVHLGNGRLLYVDADVQYMFDGEVVEIASQRNLTQERSEALQTIDFGTLPLELAIKQVNGNGKRIIAVFEDANCGYCKRLRADLVKLDDLTIYTFPLAFLAPDSDSKARKALCAADPARAWNDLLLSNRVPGNAGTCDTPMQKVHELAQKLGVTGTPVVFFSNGKRLTGYAPPEQFGRMLAASNRS